MTYLIGLFVFIVVYPAVIIFFRKKTRWDDMNVTDRLKTMWIKRGKA